MKAVNAREIAGSLRVFTAERAPIGVTLGLALGLCAGPGAMAGGDGVALLRSAALVFLVLVVLRIADVDVRPLPPHAHVPEGGGRVETGVGLGTNQFFEAHGKTPHVSDEPE